MFAVDDLLLELATESNPEMLLEKILLESQRVSGADGGTIYLLEDSGTQSCLNFALLVNNSLGVHQGGASGAPIDLEPVPLYKPSGEENHNNVVCRAALTGKVIHIEDAYNTDDFDFSGTREFDQQFNYHSQSFLTVPLLNHDEDVIGILQLLNAQDEQGNVTAFSSSAISSVTGLAGYAAKVLNNQLLVKDLKNLLDAFIKCIAQAIDAKSVHTSNHCQRIPLLMELIAQAACEDQKTFKDFSLNEDEWYELKVASWLHDCGKLATPDSVLDKATKLHLMQDGIELINTRFETAKLSVEKQMLEGIIQSPDQEESICMQAREKLQALEEDRLFVVQSNKGGEFLADEAKARLEAIAKTPWTDSAGVERTLLTPQELAMLRIEKGTLSREERNVINNHMTVTIDMLESLPFPRKLKRVPEYAGGHHEKMDGSGFPRGLTREQMSIPARMMAVADIFEALTSSDRPYKDPMKISQALDILRRMKDENHIDPDVFDLFLRARVWETYARQELKPEQLDIS